MVIKRFFSIFIIFSFLFNGLLSIRSEGADYDEAEKETRIGNLFDFYLTESFVMLRDDNLNRKVTKIVEKIIKVSDKPDIKYIVRIINSPLPVASSFPGYIYVSTGMLDILENEDELASVVAHAVAHVNEKDLYETYVSARKMKKIVFVTGSLMPFLGFSGLGVAAITGTALSTITIEFILYVVPGIYAASSMVQAMTEQKIPEKKIAINKLGPYLYLSDSESNLSVLVFFGDVYSGYKQDKEIMADKLTVDYLNKAGYKSEALITVLEKFSKLRNEYIAKGYITHLLIARPGLEQRIKDANQIIESYK